MSPSRARPALLIAVLIVPLWALTAEGRQGSAAVTGPAPDAFATVSIRRNTSGDAIHSTGLLAGGRFVAINIQVRELIRLAHGLHLSQVAGGPAWIDTDRFDIVARAGRPQPPTPSMIQGLLLEHFGLAVHRETQTLSAYELVMADPAGRMGPQLRASGIDCRAPPTAVRGDARQLCDRFAGAAPRFEAGGVTMAQLAASLSPHVGRLVIDRTGLGGRFDLDLQWTPALAQQPERPYRLNDVEVDPTGPSIFEALERQLGLRLQATRVEAEVLVVDTVLAPRTD